MGGATQAAVIIQTMAAGQGVLDILHSLDKTQKHAVLLGSAAYPRTKSLFTDGQIEPAGVECDFDATLTGFQSAIDKVRREGSELKGLGVYDITLDILENLAENFEDHLLSQVDFVIVQSVGTHLVRLRNTKKLPDASQPGLGRSFFLDYNDVRHRFVQFSQQIKARAFNQILVWIVPTLFGAASSIYLYTQFFKK